MVDHNFVNFPKFAKIVQLLQDFWVGQPLRETNYKHQILLDNPYVGKVFAVLGYLQLFGLVLLTFLRLDLGNLFTCQRLEICRVLRVGLPTGRTQAVPLRTEFVPTKSADLQIKKIKIKQL